MTILYIALGGALGALARHYLAAVVIHHAGRGLPWGTLTVNITGCFIIGLAGALAGKYGMSPHMRSFVFVGLISAFTTFSTYGLESYNLMRSGAMLAAMANILLSNLAGIAAVFIGVLISRHV